MNIYGNIWTYFDNADEIQLNEFQHFLRKGGLGKHKTRVIKDFETVLSVRGKVALSDQAEHYLDSFSLFKTAALNTETALEKIKSIRKLYYNEPSTDDLAQIFVRSFLSIIQTHLVETLGNIERISETLAAETKEKIKHTNVDNYNNYTSETFECDQTQENTNSLLNQSEISELNELNLQALQKDMDSIQQKLSSLATSNYNRIRMKRDPLEKRLEDNEMLLINSEENLTEPNEIDMDKSDKVAETYSDNDFNINGGFIGEGITQTDRAWPMERMLLSVCSKMFKEGKINESEKGQLKYLVLDNNHGLINSLKNYLENGDKEQLHMKILQILKDEEIEESADNSIA